MKNFRTMILTAVAAIVLIMNMSACSGGKSGSDAGGGGGQPVATYTTTTQAAAATSTSLGAMSTMSSQMNSGMSMGLSSVPAGYAAKFSKRYSGGNIGNLDPTLKMMVEKMAKQSRSPMIQKAVMKAASLKASRVHNVLSSSMTCTTNGSFTITGTSNFGEAGQTADIYTFDITFANCREAYIETNGTIHVEVNSSLTPTGPSSQSVRAILTEKVYSSGTSTIVTQQTDLNGTFSDINNIASGSMTADGTFVLTSPATASSQANVVNFAFNNLSDAWISTQNSDLSETDKDTVGGTFSITASSGGTQYFKFTFGVNLVDKYQYMNDGSVGTEKDWINGTITLTWVPDYSAYGCIPGSITVSTTETDPLIYNNANGSCPVSGTLTINNATIAYGSSSGTPTDIIVTVNGSSQTFDSCDALDSAGGACMY